MRNLPHSLQTMILTLAPWRRLATRSLCALTPLSVEQRGAASHRAITPLPSAVFCRTNRIGDARVDSVRSAVLRCRGASRTNTAGVAWVARGLGAHKDWVFCRALSSAPVGVQDTRATAVSEPGPVHDGTGEAMKDEVLELLDEKKAMDVVVLCASEIAAMRVLCEYMVILTCTSRRHMKIVADHVVEHFRLKGMLLEVEDEDGIVRPTPPSIEGTGSDEWMLVDLQDVIVQIFSPEGREKYQLEAHWRSQSGATRTHDTAAEEAAKDAP